MSNLDKTANKEKTPSQKPLADEYGNFHYLADELARGGQGVVFYTTDVDLAIKQPLDASDIPDKNANLRDRFQNIRLLPLPPHIPISLPLAILRDEPGYVMRLLTGMTSFEVFEMNGTTKRERREALAAKELELPKWLAETPDQDMVLRLFHYTDTGSTCRRLLALSKCASILARLHAAGLVYGDISLNNVFVGEGDSREVWLIDADNLRFELSERGNTIITPFTLKYGAPEIVQGCDQSRPRTDCWAFAVMAFRVLALCHPFIGKKVLEPDNDEGGWDAESIAVGAPTDLDEQAYAGYLPFIDDENDDSNAAITCPPLPRELVTTPRLRSLFQETFGEGRTQSHRRPSMLFWAIELARAFDRSLICAECKMSYFVDNHRKCPYCDATRPAFARAKTPRWEMLIVADTKQFALRHRLFNPFSVEHNDDAECEVAFDFEKKTAVPVRRTSPFPPDLSFEFVEAEK
jgi:serine/threonine protein kinase